jgi:hypothetical protein
MTDAERSAATVLDRLAPTFQAAERHSATIAASTDQVWAALTQVTVSELGLFRLLMDLRMLPGRLLGRPHARFDADEPLLDWAVRFGFTILGEEVRRELVVGAIGQPWRLVGGRGRAVAGGDAFAAFDQAGYAKMAANFRLAPLAGGRAVQLTTETRVACTDAASARRFARYWWLIRPASGVIRRSWLAAIKRRAERRPNGDANPSRGWHGRRGASSRPPWRRDPGTRSVRSRGSVMPASAS